MPSASLQPSVIDDYLYTELVKGRVAGPFSSPPLPHLHISRFGVIPKKHQPGKWRWILHLSSGMQWQGNYFVDMALPFGLRSAS